MHTHRKFSLARVLRGHVFSVVILAWPACCYSCPPEEVDPTPAVTNLAILPPNTSVASAEPFELRVQITDGANQVLPGDFAAAATWSATGELVVSGPTGERGYFKAVGPPGSRAKVTVTLGTVNATADVHINDEMVAVPDWIAGKHLANLPPMLSLVDGESTGGPVSDSLFSFVRSGPMLAFNVGSSDVVVFARNRRVTDAMLPVTPKCDQLNLKPSVGSPPPEAPCDFTHPQTHKDPPSVRVRVFATPEAAGQVTQDIAYAKRAYADAWSGIDLNVTTETSGLTFTRAVVGLTSAEACRYDGDPASDVSWQLVNLMGLPAPPSINPPLQPNLITVAYMDRIEISGSGITVPGLHCGWHDMKGTIILIDANGHPTSTLAHELGHAFGLTHTELIPMTPPFDASNLLWGPEVDGAVVIRTVLTLGQAYRAARAKGSFLEHMGESVTPCQWDHSLDTPCPRLRRDVLKR